MRLTKKSDKYVVREVLHVHVPYYGRRGKKGEYFFAPTFVKPPLRWESYVKKNEKIQNIDVAEECERRENSTCFFRMTPP